MVTYVVYFESTYFIGTKEEYLLPGKAGERLLLLLLLLLHFDCFASCQYVLQFHSISCASVCVIATLAHHRRYLVKFVYFHRFIFM